MSFLSDHEEAETKLVALVQAADVAPGEAVMVRSPSGDIDILALFLGHDSGDIHVLVDNGTGKSRKVIDIGTSPTLPNIQKQALIGLHAFSGNYYVSSFFRKGKIAFWKAMLKRAEFIELFAGLGVTTNLSGTSAINIEKFVCFLYGDQRIASVDELRLLPPCRSNLRIHTTRANYVTQMYRAKQINW